MVTPDKDFAQSVIIFSCIAQCLEDMKHGDKEVKEKFEVNDPKQVIDFLGMKGDAVDNILATRSG